MIDARLTVAARRSEWDATLAQIGRTPLQLLPAFPEIARRWLDWWAFANDRPLVIAQVPQAGAETIRWDKGFDLLDDTAAWLAMHRAQVENTRWMGDAIPSVRVDIGPVATAAFAGAPLHFAAKEQTSWQTPIIDSWDQVAALEFDPENEWFVKVMRLTEALADDARGRYLVCLPDLTGAVDALANLRTSQVLCFDLYENREAVVQAAERLVNIWEQAFVRLYDAVLGRGAGITQWVTCWADRPFTVPTCDFNALIGANDFREVCMPSLNEQARRAGSCVFHLDGPDAARHAETLAASPAITAVQYTPGAGTPSALDKLPLFRMFQEQRKPLFIETPVGEARQLMESLDPRGLAIRLSGLSDPADAEALLACRDQA